MAAAPELRRYRFGHTGAEHVRHARWRVDPHLFTYTVGNALAWILWAAVSVTADHWYWWVVIPLLGWMLVLALHSALDRRTHANDRRTT